MTITLEEAEKVLQTVDAGDEVLAFFAKFSWE